MVLKMRLLLATFFILFSFCFAVYQWPDFMGRMSLQEYNIQGKPIRAPYAQRLEKEGAWVPYFMIRDKPYVRLQDLSERIGSRFSFDPAEGTAELRVGEAVIQFVKDTPILRRNGLYLPNSEKTLFWGNTVWIPASALSGGLDYELLWDDASTVFKLKPKSQEVSSLAWRENSKPRLEKMSAKELAEYLSFLKVPIDGAHLSSKASHLPGAPRPYRNGIHEGIDWYAMYSGIPINQRTPVKSMADGMVVRADVDYQEYSANERKEDLSLTVKYHRTPEYILDKLRGRTVWVQYDRGVMVRYAHLSSIEKGIAAGKSVQSGDIIGYVGNSGTSYGVDGSAEGLHLHSDILIYGDPFWKYTEQEKIRVILERLFP